jgi:poly(hydroxyalkanoate) depolymerase family esterase
VGGAAARRPQATDRFISAVFTGAAGTRPYKLYVPAGYRGRALPLVVMLHGCTQSPDDFAAGTAMNLAAEQDDFLVLYPAQTHAANASKCWNWFSPADQHRGHGEPALIADLIALIMREYRIDRDRVYVAGLSAGGAAAAVLAAAYPDLFAAAAIHSGLACGVATDMMSALAIMRQGAANAAPAASPIPVILFQGDQDSTVNKDNLAALRSQFRAAALRPAVEKTTAYTRTLYRDEDGIARIEEWLLHGMGHAWSGGDPSGTYTAPNGPNATREILRFFHAHPKQAAGTPAA